jgi:hypothetical protein
LSKAIPTNTAASAKQRLLNRARAKKEDFNLLLTKFALERVLYRIANRHTKTPSFSRERCFSSFGQNRPIGQPQMRTSSRKEKTTSNGCGGRPSCLIAF